MLPKRILSRDAGITSINFSFFFALEELFSRGKELTSDILMVQGLHFSSVVLYYVHLRGTHASYIQQPTL